MNLKLRALGTGLIAVFAMAAYSATASAFPMHIGASNGTIVGVNVGEEEFITNAGTVRCKTTRYEGKYSSSTPGTITVKPKYEGCTAWGFVGTPISVGTCEFELNTSSGFTNLVDIVNCGTGFIVVEAYNCWVYIGNQSGLSHIVWSNKGNSPHDVHATTTLSGITYRQETKKFPQCTNGTFNNGVYKGTNTVRAFDAAENQVSITVT